MAARPVTNRRRAKKSAVAFRTISEVAKVLDVPTYVLRFWEAKFEEIQPLKRGGKRRYYRPEDVDFLRQIQFLLYDQGYTIKGVQKLLKANKGKLDNIVKPAIATEDILDPDKPVDTVTEAERLVGRENKRAPKSADDKSQLSPHQVEQLEIALEELRSLKQLL